MARKDEITQKALKYMGCKWDFINGAEWADKTIIERATKWIKENANNYTEKVQTIIGSIKVLNTEKMANDFKKTMEE